MYTYMVGICITSGQLRCSTTVVWWTGSVGREPLQYIRNGAIRRLAYRPKYCVGAFMVPKHDGGHRLIIDMRPINKYFPHCKVSYETLSWLSDAPRQTVAAASVNLSSGYHHLRLHPELQQYMCFQMEG